MAKHYGWKRTPEQIAKAAKWQAELPDKVDLRDTLPPVFDQGELGSSAVCAVTTALQHLKKKLK